MKSGLSAFRRAALFATALCVLARLLAGCASTPVAPYQGAAPKLATLYVVAEGWHTEIGLPADALGGPLAALKADFVGAPYLLFGWGAHDYYMARNPSFADALAALLPGPAVMLVTPMTQSPLEAYGGTDVFALRVSREGMDRLSQYLWEYLEKNGEGAAIRVGDGPTPHSIFYAATGTYNFSRTCNTWTAEALHVAGLPVDAGGILFAGQVVDAVRGLSQAPAGD